MGIHNPIFLVGAERSGTTLLRLMLDHHPKIAFHHEFEYAVDQIEASGQWPALDDYHQYLSTHRIFLNSKFTLDKSLDYPELLNSFLLQKQERSGNKPLVGATVHYHFHHLLSIWPQARFIHLVRDGRDVARSTIAMGWAGNLYTAVDNWIEAEQLWHQMSAHLPPEQKVTVRYEDLIQYSDEILTQICTFLGVAFDKAIYDYAENSTYSLPEPHLLNQWQRKLSEREIRLAEARIGALLKERGYELSGLPYLNITKTLQRYYRFHDRWAITRFRLRRYPFRLYLADVVSRRLPFKNWQKQVQLRMNEWDNQFMK